MMKILLGLIAMALVSSAAYTLVSYPPKLWWPYFMLVSSFASIYCIFVVGPLVAVLIWKDWVSLVTFIGFLAILTFTIFLVWNLVSYGSAIKYIEGGRVLVEDGSITASGYAKSIADSAITTLIGVLGGLVLWFSALRSQNPGQPRI